MLHPLLPEPLRQQIASRRTALAAELEHMLPDKPLTLEFGCGHGHYLCDYAAAFPETYCLGLDLVSKRVEKANAKVARRRLPHVTFLKAEADECLLALPERITLAAVFMLFPDPWPKLRHHKNRMLQHAFLEKVAAKALPGSPFYFRTDHEGLFDWAIEHFRTNPHWRLDEEAPWPFEAPSYFQNLMETWQSLVAVRR